MACATIQRRVLRLAAAPDSRRSGVGGCHRLIDTTQRLVHASTATDRTTGAELASKTSPMTSIGTDGSSHLRSARRGCPLAEHGEWVGGSATWPERHRPERYLGFGHVARCTHKCEMPPRSHASIGIASNHVPGKAMRPRACKMQIRHNCTVLHSDRHAGPTKEGLIPWSLRGRAGLSAVRGRSRAQHLQA